MSENNKNINDFFEEVEKKAGGMDGFLNEAGKLRTFLDWNNRFFSDGGRFDILKDPSTIAFLSNGFDLIALHFDAKTKTFKSYNASSADLMEWIASEKEADPVDFEDWNLEDVRPAAAYMQRFLSEFEEDDGR